MAEVTEKLGTKETEEMIKAMFAVTAVLIERFKDGAGLDDVLAIYEKLTKDEAFLAVITEAYDGYKSIPAEIKDLDIAEGFALAGVVLPEVLTLIQSLK